MNRLVLFAILSIFASHAPVSASPPINSTLTKVPGSLQEFNAIVSKLTKADQAKLFRALKISPRIVGGRSVDAADFGWQVALIQSSDPELGRSVMCGGTLVLPNFVVTAAHCIDNKEIQKQAGRVDVIAGTAFYGTGGERIPVKAVFIHPNWNPSNQDFDVAVLQLAQNSHLGVPIRLQTSPVTSGETVKVSGWGALTEGGSTSADIMYAAVHVIDTATCQAAPGYGAAVTPEMFCAGERDGGLDACQGDSGGPLVVGSGPGARLVGIVSWGIGCARAGKYGVYTRVSAIADWVQNLVGANPVTVAQRGSDDCAPQQVIQRRVSTSAPIINQS